MRAAPSPTTQPLRAHTDHDTHQPMPSDIHGPQGDQDVTGYQMADFEHRLRLDFSTGGTDTGLQRALATLDDVGLYGKYREGAKRRFDDACEMVEQTPPIEWEVCTIVDSERDYQRADTNDGNPVWLEEITENSGGIDITVFDMQLPTKLLTVKSSHSKKRYAWAPLTNGIAICCCPSKFWHYDHPAQGAPIFPLCKHEVASLLLLAQDDFTVETTTLDPAKTSLIGKHTLQFSPSEPANHLH